MAQRLEWRNVFEGREITTGDNSEVRTALIETTDLSITGVVSVRKWAKYTTADDKAAGMTKDDVPFRPTKDGLSFPVSIIPEIIEDLQKIYDLSAEKGVASYVPKESAEKQVEKKAAGKRSVVKANPRVV